jgi:hypothetical protein
MSSNMFITGLKYGGVFLGGLMAGGMIMKKAIENAMKKNYDSLMGQMDPNAMQAMMQQLQGGGALQGTGYAPQAGNMNGFDVTLGQPGVMPGNVHAPQVQNSMAMPKVQVNRSPIQPLNLTAGQLTGGGGLRV